MMKTLIVGMGEVGSALFKVLKDFDPVSYDTGKGQQVEGATDFEDSDPMVKKMVPKEFEIMHICFPYSENFINQVNAYQEKYKPKYTVIHSTVPVGTSRKCGALHSPIRGIHPHLAEGITTFVKFIGGAEGSAVADYFRRAGIKVCLVDDPETTEAGKLFDTEYYRVCIEFTQRVKKFCTKHGLNFHEVYTIMNLTYNEGYTALGRLEFVRPVLQPIMTDIGGHCVKPNEQLIKESE